MARAYTGIEPGLSQANREIIRYDRNRNHRTKYQVEKIANRIKTCMRRISPLAFAALRPKIFGGGSSYEGLKVGERGDYDIDILFQMPKIIRPVLWEDVIPGFVQLRLENFDALEAVQPELHRAMSNFVDQRNYLLTTPLKSFVQSVFDRARNSYFPEDVINLGTKRYRILRVQNGGPALTLTIEGLNTDFSVEIDLVPGILLPKQHWPARGFRSNPHSEPSDFFLIPKQPKRLHPHLDRFFRLSFQKQERKMICNRYWFKPTIRIMKCMRDHFDHPISSYAIKTIFMLELLMGNPDLWKGTFSDCLVHMLQKYVDYLSEPRPRIPYFWNGGLNLLDNLSNEQIAICRRDVELMLEDIRANPFPETILAYLTLNE